MSVPFKFKEFTVSQDQCAMKIGTDGVLLGAWASVAHEPNSILDIGAGTGILALMLAQRSTAETIDALEIDENAYAQAVENFESSPWGDRLFCYHAAFLEYVAEIDEEYDLIISNPPFYSEDYKTEDSQRDLARFQDALPFEHLLAGTTKLLSENGEASFIIPFAEEEKFVAIALKCGLFLNKVAHVQGTQTSSIKRSLLAFSFQQKTVEESVLVIEIARHQYTEEYINLTQAFYLKM